MPGTTTLPRGSGRCISYKSLPHCLTAWGQRNSCNALPHCLGALCSGTLAMHCHNARGRGHSNSCNTLPWCLGAVGGATPALHCPTAWGQWAVQLLQRTASVPGGSRQRTLAMPGHTSWGTWSRAQEAVGASRAGLPQCTAKLPGAVGGATPLIHCLAAWGQRAVQLLQCTASLPGGGGQCGPASWGDGESCPRGGRSVWSGTRSMHCLTPRGQWAVEILQCAGPAAGGARGSCPEGSCCLKSGTPAMHCHSAWGSAQCNSCNTVPHCR